MPSRALSDLHPVVQQKAQQLLAQAQAQGVTVIITSTLRSFPEQTALYAQGRTTPGKIVTNAKAGQSWHNFGLAFDVVPVVNGAAVWDATSPLWEVIGKIGQSLGLKWGRDFPKPDRPHFEYHPSLTLTEAKRRYSTHENLLA